MVERVMLLPEFFHKVAGDDSSLTVTGWVRTPDEAAKIIQLWNAEYNSSGGSTHTYPHPQPLPRPDPLFFSPSEKKRLGHGLMAGSGCYGPDMHM